MKIAGVGPEAPTVTLANGAKQSQTPARLDLIPMLALLHVGAILQEGAAKYGEENWRGIPVRMHLNKALIHIAAFLAGDTQDDHIGHACCRLQMALEKHLSEQGEPTKDDGKKRIYIAGPISKGDLLGNVNQATAAFTELMKAGFAPFCPHWSVYAKPARRNTPGHVLCTATADGNGLPHDAWLGVDVPWVRVADALLRLPGESKGADQEVAEANRLSIPVFYSVADVVAWASKPVAS